MKGKVMVIRQVLNVKLGTIILAIFAHIGLSFSHELKVIRIDAETSKNDNYRIFNYSLDMSNLYKKNLKVITYNIVFPKNENNYERILLISVLPDHTSGDQWTKIDTSEMELQDVPIIDLQSLFVSNVGYTNGQMKNIERKYFNKYQVVFQNNGETYISKNCLLELFEVKSVDPIFPSPYGQLNLMESPIKIKDYVNQFSKHYSFYSPALSGFVDDTKKLNYREWWRIWKDYLSDKVKFSDAVGYKFWTTAFNNSNHNLDFSRGVERFIYIPERGIVAGSYDFFFNPLMEDGNKNGESGNEIMLRNVLEEKVSVADGLVLIDE
ncbi:hypothetical protein [Sphingobacterium corticibacter]|uniref:Uncharacterized protein n=1 Tax=Sphingobacterium corticibacter TaxID=2171749 RepID=A0A2T8HLJ3_9SPHI|nr:hypothetical protein [Sphingobacterium corticibacter]PVH26285.1 hypothetical protein DC487_01270 [Sphingobacterium corticibacter]